jgi:hypothetical protein
MAGTRPAVSAEEIARRLSLSALSPASPMLSVADVAAHLGVDPSYVYAHADELGARRLGSGPKARLRFSLEDVNRAVSCSVGRESSEAQTPTVEPKRRRRRPGGLGTGIELLPIRGRLGPS